MAPAKSTITFDLSLRGTILLTSGDLNIAKDLTIRGPGAGILSISGGKSGHLVCVLGASVTISGLTFENTKTAGGLIVNNGGTLTLNNSTVSGNTASGSNILGGGILNQGTLTLTNSTVSGNTATDANVLGGGIFNGGTLTLTNSTVSGNTATDPSSAGAGIFNNGGTLTLSNSTVSGNTITGSGSIGGGIYNNGGTLTLSNSTVSGNTVTGSGSVGGGINNNGGTLTLSNSTVSDNTATNGNGGGILNQNTFTPSNSTISGNTEINGNGGGIANTNTKITLTNSTISDNKASSNGGGIAISNDTSSGQIPSSAMLLYCTVYGNTADVGGGIWVGNHTQGQLMTMGASIIAGNNAHSDPDIVGSLTTLGYNLVGDRSDAAFLGSPKVQSTDVLGVSLTNLGIDPKLRDNGGSAKPHTWTHALLPGSPAIDLIPPEACMMLKVQSDQRGVKRLQEKGCDSGAYE